MPLVLLALTVLAGSSHARAASAGAAAAAVTDPVIAAAGDISCDPSNSNFNGGNGTSSACAEKATSNLLVGAGLSAVLPLGDNQYECGSLTAFQQSYDPTWGRVKSITDPVTGNHEYLTSGGTGCNSTNAGAAGYFGYFGPSVKGPDGFGYYSYDVGTWHIIALNSQCGPGGGCSAGTQQETWLRNDLAAHKNFCTLAYWHIPLYSSGGRATTATQVFWQDLYNADADVVLNGHDHIYERFAPQNANGQLDTARGIREFIVGTGGNNHTSIVSVAPNSEVRDTSTFGVLELTLHPTSYDWKFVPAAGTGTFTDSGTAQCHGTQTDTTPPTAPTNLTAKAVSPSEIDLSWTASTDNVGVAGYEVFRDGVLQTTVTTTSFADTGLAPSTTHSYQVYAIDTAGNLSPASNTATATTQADTSPPTAPGSLTATAASSSEVDLAWTASTDNVGVDHYAIARNGTQIATAPGTATSFADTTVAASTAYTYVVTAVDKAGNVSPPSNSASVTTPAPPTTLTFTPTDDTYVESDTATTNYGTATDFFADGSPIKDSLLKFNVSGINGRKVVSATLRIFCVDDPSVHGGEVHRLASTTWSESTVTWNTAPTPDATVLDQLGAVNVSTWYTLNVTPAVTGDGVMALELTNTNSDGANYASKEGGAATAPQLIVQVQSTDTTPPTQPGSLAVTGTTDTTVSLGWTASTDNVGVDHYEISRNGVVVGTTTGTSFKDVGLAPSTLYHYSVVALDAAGNRSTAATVSGTTAADTTPPTAPTGLTAGTVTSSQVPLSWTAATDDVGVTGYRVYRNGAFLASATGTSYTDTTVASGVTYSYAVSAVDAAGNESPKSTAISVTTPDTVPPTQPGTLTVAATTDTSVKLTWTASTDNVGVDHYEISRNSVVVGTTTSTSFTNTGLAPSTLYHYSVVALDAAGNRSTAATVDATTAADTTPPAAPTGLTAGTVTSSQVPLSWTAATDDVGVTGYRVYRNGAFLASATGTSYTDTTVSGSTTYSYAVTAVDAAGNESPKSTALSVTTPAAPDTTPPTQPGSLTVTGRTDTTVSLGWTASTDNVAVDHYEVSRNGVVVGTSTGTSFTDRGLSPSTLYHYSVVALDAAGNRSTAATVDGTTAADTSPPTAPTGLTAGTVTGSQVPLSWTAASDDVGVTGYRVYRNGAFLASATGTSYTDTTVTNATTYTYAVTAVDAAGNESPLSTGVTVTTPDTAPPTQPGSPAVAGTTDTSVSLTWTASTDNVAVDHYEISRNGVVVGTTTGTTFTDTALAPSTLYHYSVVALDAAGNRSTAATVDATTAADTTPPAAPTGLAAGTVTSSQVPLSWNAATDDVGVTGYRIYRNGSLLASPLGTSTIYTDTTVSGSTTYTYAVTAVDAAGNESPKSTAISVTTPASTVQTLFSDGFETGDLSKWSTVVGITAQQQLVFDGAWSARMTSNGGTTGTYAYGTLSSTATEIHYSLEFQIVSQATNVNLLRLRTATKSSLGAVYVSAGGSLSVRNDIAGISTQSSTTVSTGVWHSLQVHVIVGGTTGSLEEVWLDGVQVAALTRTDTLGTNPVGIIQLGESLTPRTYDVAYDDVKVTSP